jgi:hypothetical protein
MGVDQQLSKQKFRGREGRESEYLLLYTGHRVSEYSESDTPLHFDESDNNSKHLVAKKVVDEGSEAGTTNVIRRLSELSAPFGHIADGSRDNLSSCEWYVSVSTVFENGGGSSQMSK